MALTTTPIKATSGTIKITPEQVAASAYKAGFRDRALIKITAIAGAESVGYHLDSAGDVGYATGPFGRSGPSSFGPVQVHVLPFATPPLHAQYDPYKLISDLDYSMRAAWDISGGGKSFTPWSTYTGGQYVAYLPQARIAAKGAATFKGPLPAQNPQAQGASDSGGGGIGDIFSFLFNGGLLRIAEVIIGFGAVILGAIAFARIDKEAMAVAAVV